MKKYDFSDISIITHIRLDTDERLRNIKLRDEFYKLNCDNVEFVYIEDDITSKFIDFDDSCSIHKLHYNDDEYCRPLCYNIGAKLTNRPFLYFLDADCIIHPRHIFTSARRLHSNDNIGALNPYNGTALYTHYNVKDAFEKDPSYELLMKYFPKRVQTHYRDDNLLVGNTNALGGAWLARRDVFDKYNGFNALFKGWGYEDNEFPVRLSKLGFSFGNNRDKDAVLWHFPHDCPGQSAKAENKYLSHNQSQLKFVQAASKEQMLEYITKW